MFKWWEVYPKTINNNKLSQKLQLNSVNVVVNPEDKTLVQCNKISKNKNWKD